MPVVCSGRFPFANISPVLRGIKDMCDELSLCPHGGRELAADAFDRAAKKPAICTVKSNSATHDLYCSVTEAE